MEKTKYCKCCDTIKPVSEFDERNGKRQGQYYPLCKPCRRDKNYTHYRMVKQKKPFVQRCYAIKDKCKRQKIDFDLTPEFLESIWSGYCKVSNIELDIYADRGTIKTPELDRVDPNKGYIQGNVQWISHTYNRIKCNASIEDLKMIINYIERFK